MANYNAPDILKDGCATQIWLASNEKLTGITFSKK